MRYPFIALVFLCFLGFSSCEDEDTPTPNLPEEPAIETIVPAFNFTLDNGEEFTTSEPIMHYDSLQQTTFIKHTTDDIKVRVNFKGRTEGTYTGQDAVFYKFSYNEEGEQNIDIVCDSLSDIELVIEEYGEIGEAIKGSFVAENCDGLSTATTASGNFSVIRTD